MTNALAQKLIARALPAVICALAACNGIGREIVDRVPPPPPSVGQMQQCTPMTCDQDAAIETVTSDTAMSLDEVDDHACPLGEPQSVASGTLEPSYFCKDLLLETHSAGGECAIVKDALELEHVHLAVHASAPCAVVLTGLRATDVQLRLEGPVELRIEQESTLLNVGVIGVGTEAGEPNVSLDSVSGERVVLGDAQQPFEGALAVRDTYLLDSMLVASHAQLETAQLERTGLDLAYLATADAIFDHAQLDVGTAVIAASRLERSEIRSCDSLSVVDTSINASVLRGCGSRSYRLFGNVIAGGVIEGRVESDGSRFYETRFGVELETDVIMFAGGASHSAFCEHATRYRFGSGAAVSCSSCIAGSDFEQSGVCMLPGADTGDYDPRHCAGFAMKVPCAGPLPERMRDRSLPAGDAVGSGL